MGSLARARDRWGRAIAATLAVVVVGGVGAACGPSTDGGASFIGGSATSGLPRSASVTSAPVSTSPPSAPPTATADWPSPSPVSTDGIATPSGQPTDEATAPSSEATGGAPSTEASLTTPSGLSTADETEVPDGHAVCDSVSAEDLQTIFGAPVATKPDRTLASCQFSGGGAQMAVSVYDADADGLFTIAGQKKSENGGQDLVVAGHPAVLTGDDNLCVSRSMDPAAGGILKIYGLWDGQEVQIGTALAEKIIPHFAVPDGG